MKFYYNAEGYSDPSAGVSIEAVAHARRRDRRTERDQAQAEYEALCRLFREAAEVKGFSFPGQIWLRNESTGEIFKSG